VLSREPVSYICHWNDAKVLKERLLDSLSLVEGDEVLLFSGMPSIAQAYQRGQAIASNRIRVFVHQDVSFSRDSNKRFRDSIGNLEAQGKPWGTLGALGVKYGFSEVKGTETKIDIYQIGSVASPNLGQDIHSGVSEGPEEVNILDAVLCIVNGAHIDFDPQIPGWHGAVEDLCMQMAKHGRTVYVSDLDLTHWTAKSFEGREDEIRPSASYLLSKWGSPLVLANSVWQ
jgi:hypothetical protein